MARAPANPGLIRVDLLAFTLGLTSYAELVGGKAEGASVEVLKSGARHCIRAEVSGAMTDFLSECQRTFEDESAPPMMLMTVLKQAETKRGTAKFLFIGEKLPAIFNWFQAHQADFQDLLPGPARTSIQPLLKLGDMVSPMQRLQALGEFEYRSTFRVFQRWIVEEALPSLGLQLTGVRAVAADIGAIKPYVAKLKEVQEQLAGVDPGSEEAAQLNEEKQQLTQDLDSMVEDSANPQAVETAAGQALSEDNSPLAKLSKKYRLDAEQAAVVAYKGWSSVSAVPGSGKTTTMIALIQDSLDRGYQPDQILGCTFSKAAEEEFNERLATKGVSGVRFGTTHSIAREVILAGAPQMEAQLDESKKRGDALFKIACKQVQMRAPAGGVRPDLHEEPIVPDEAAEGSVADHLARVQAVIRKHDPNRMWASVLGDFERTLKSQNAKPLSPRQLETVEKFERTPPGGFRRRGSEEIDAFFRSAAPSKRDDKKGPQTKYWNQPANMWWNLGITLGKRMSVKGLQTIVGRWQNGGLSWQKIWAEKGEMPPPRNEDEGLTEELAAAAVYAAYSWLKQNDPQYGPVLDFNDWLGKALEIFKRKPKLLASWQSRYKVLVADEAQDLNVLQWELFDQLGEKTDRYVFVGDPDQAIYQFRGAATDKFMEKLQDGKFKQFTIGTNYRSGSTIVDTAQALIRQNEMPIPRICRAARASGKGVIEARIVPTHEDVALQTAEMIDNGIRGGTSPSEFGIAVRNNAEMDAFCLALMAKKIPFLCKRDPLKGPTPRIVLAWFTLAMGSEKASREQINDAIVVAHQNPGFGLDTVFAANLRAGVTPGSDQLQTLLAGGVQIYTEVGQTWRNEGVDLYAEAIRKIQGYSKSEDLLRAILEVRGKHNTLLDKLKEDVDPEDIPPGLTGKDLEEAEAAAAQVPLSSLFGVAEGIPDPQEFLEYINKLRNAKETAKANRGKNDTAVRIGTSHGWKGLEVEHMFVVMADGVFPNPMAPEEDERNLAYVAVTRGKKAVTVFSPLVSYRGPPRTPFGVPPPPPRASVFVDEMATGGCMATYGQELVGGARRDMGYPASEDSEEDTEEKDGSRGPARFARRIMASLDQQDVLEDEPLDSQWKILV